MNFRNWKETEILRIGCKPYNLGLYVSKPKYLRLTLPEFTINPLLRLYFYNIIYRVYRINISQNHRSEPIVPDIY
ncbi:MAG: hypothetical protein CI953_1492 [Methanohalophilus sp.]|jgi:hypothetical protein|nr:MAG: hypothetical protein CI953_1492 [Methanohalophilus sp.]